MKSWSTKEKKTRRVYCELDLQLRKKTPKRRVKAKLREPIQCYTTERDLGDGVMKLGAQVTGCCYTLRAVRAWALPCCAG